MQAEKIANPSNFDSMQSLTESIPSRICTEQQADNSSNKLSKVTMEQYSPTDRRAQVKPTQWWVSSRANSTKASSRDVSDSLSTPSKQKQIKISWCNAATSRSTMRTFMICFRAIWRTSWRFESHHRRVSSLKMSGERLSPTWQKWCDISKLALTIEQLLRLWWITKAADPMLFSLSMFSPPKGQETLRDLLQPSST